MTLENSKRVHSGIVNFERRMHPRISVDLPIEYARMEASPPLRNGRAANASQGGLLVYVPEAIEMGQVLKVKIYFSFPEIQEIELVAEVVWVSVPIGKNPEEYRAGLRFIEISQENQQKLSNFLKIISP